MIRNLLARVRRHFADRRRALPAGCCGCGADVVRYVYTDQWKGRTVQGEGYCTACAPGVSEPPALDFGRDVATTIGEIDDAIAAGLTYEPGDVR